MAAEEGDKPETLGGGTTVKVTPLLAVPLTVTTTLPAAAPVGTVATIVLFPQLVTLAVTPLNLTELLPWELPKPDPLIVTDAPIAPDVGLRLEMLGAEKTGDAKQQSKNRGGIARPRLAQTK